MRYAVFGSCALFMASILSAEAQFITASTKTKVTPAELMAPDNIPYKERIFFYNAAVSKIRALDTEVQEAIKAADASNSLSQYKAAIEDQNNLMRALAPYGVAHAQAKNLADSGSKLASWEGSVCKDGKCASVDPLVAFYMIVLGALADELNKEKPFDPDRNDLIKFLIKPAGGDNSVVVQVREFFLNNDQGEISKLIRDPIKRPIEVVQNIRDAIISPKDNGEIAKAIRDPIKCTVGHLWGGCR